jgi:hypothetical protein
MAQVGTARILILFDAGPKRLGAVKVFQRFLFGHPSLDDRKAIRPEAVDTDRHPLGIDVIQWIKHHQAPPNPPARTQAGVRLIPPETGRGTHPGKDERWANSTHAGRSLMQDRSSASGRNDAAHVESIRAFFDNSAVTDADAMPTISRDRIVRRHLCRTRAAQAAGAEANGFDQQRALRQNTGTLRGRLLGGISCAERTMTG